MKGESSMNKFYKKGIILLMALSMTLVIAGCNPREESGANDADSTITNTDMDTAETDSTETKNSSEDEEQPAESMEVQDNLNLEIGKDEEGAW